MDRARYGSGDEDKGGINIKERIYGYVQGRSLAGDVVPMMLSCVYSDGTRRRLCGLI